jgi:hypothetical protein
VRLFEIDRSSRFLLEGDDIGMDIDEAKNDLLDRIILLISKDVKEVDINQLVDGLRGGGADINKDWVREQLEDPSYQSMVSRIDGDTVKFSSNDDKDEDGDGEDNFAAQDTKDKSADQVSKMAKRQLKKQGG